MGFYGNVVDIEKNSSFTFDKIYPNRKYMEESASTDGVYLGRYVLIEYDTDYSSFDYKRAYLKENDITLYESIPLYSSSGTGKDTKITYSATQNIFKDNLIYVITKGTLVYVSQNAINTYYTCVGYYYINDDDICQININGKSYEIKDPDKKITESSIKNTYYALFQKVNGIGEDGQNNYAKNYNIDIAYAKEKGYNLTGHGWDSTVWEKVYIDNVEKYVMIAELNTVVPTFDLSADAPTQMPIPPHFDTASTDVYYKLHWQPQWGLRVGAASGIQSTNSAIMEPNTEKILSDDTTTWIRELYNITTGRSDKYYLTTSGEWKKFDSLAEIGDDGKIPAAIYYNKAGFDSKVRYKSSLNDSLKIGTTGYSQSLKNGVWENTKYNTHDGNKQAEAVDTQELQMILPSLGNTISDIWDLVYGTGIGNDENENDKSFARLTDISWRSTPITGEGQRLQLIQTNDENSYSYHKADVETVAGAINSVHDLMGMIIVEGDTPENLDDFATNKASNNNIYYFNNKFYRKAQKNELTELLDNEYIYESVTITKDSYNKNIHYVKNGDSYDIAIGNFDSNTQYYIRKVESGYKVIEIAKFQDLVGENIDLLYKNTSNDYIFDSTYHKGEIYYSIDENKLEKKNVQGGYKPNIYYYKSGDDYILDKNLNGATQELEYVLSNFREIYAKSIYFPYHYYAVSQNDDGDTLYAIDGEDFTPGKTYYTIRMANNTSEIKNKKLVYPRKRKEPKTVERAGQKFSVYATIKNNIEVYKDASGNYIIVTSDTPIALKDDEVYQVFNYPSTGDYIAFKGDTEGVVYVDTNGKPIFNTYNPSDAGFESVNYLYIVEEITLTNSVTQIEYYRKTEDGYIRIKNHSDVDTATNTDIFYLLKAEEFAHFYQSNKYYYKGKDGKSWLFDKGGVFQEDRQYYIIPSEAISQQEIDLTDKYLYEPGRFYYKKNNRYYLDNNSTATEGRTYYLGSEEFCVATDESGVLSRGMTWNGALPIPVSVTLGRRKYGTYTMKELIGFARSLNTIHGLMLQINNFLEYGNEDTRDTSTVQGMLNTLNDIIVRFELLDPCQSVITDIYGRLHTAPILTDNWLKSIISQDPESPTVSFAHLYPNKIADTPSDLDLNTANEKNKIELITSNIDETGHVTNKDVKTVTLPFGFKTIFADKDKGFYTAVNTQDSFEIKTKDAWLSTAINNNILTIEHNNAQTAKTTKGLLADNSPKFGESFVIPKVGIDDKGHVSTLDEHTITLPKITISADETGNVVTEMTIDETSGVITKVKENVGTLKLGTYAGTVSEGGDINSDDSISTAIGKNAYKLSVLNGSADTEGSLAHEAKLRADADAGLRELITNTGGSIATEATERENADNALGLRIDGVIGDLGTETDTRTSADSALSDRLDNLEELGISGRLTSNESSIASTKSDLTELTKRVNTLESAGYATQINNLQNSLNSHTTSASATIQGLTSTINSLEERIAALEGSTT